MHLLHTAESKMVRSCADLAFASCTNDVTGAILIGTEEGSSAMNFLWLIGFRGIE